MKKKYIIYIIISILIIGTILLFPQGRNFDFPRIFINECRCNEDVPCQQGFWCDIKEGDDCGICHIRSSNSGGTDSSVPSSPPSKP